MCQNCRLAKSSRLNSVRKTDPPFSTKINPQRDPQLIQIETVLSQAIWDAADQGTRKPFTWGGLRGDHQRHAIAQGFAQLDEFRPRSSSSLLLKKRVEFVLTKTAQLPMI